jgi:thioredoxin reductase (NADPH)
VSRPVLLAVDENQQSLEAIEAELLDRYERAYRIVCVGEAPAAEAEFERLAAAGEDVALVLAGETLDGAPGSEFLGRVRKLHPQAQRALLIDFGSWGKGPTGGEIFAAMARRRIDYYLIRPIEPQDEMFHQAISTFLFEWQNSLSLSSHTAYVVGESWSGRAHELREVLGRCALPHKFCLADSEEGRQVVEQVGEVEGLPLVMFPNGEYLVDPSNAELTIAAGGPVDPQGRQFDLVIVGAGPSGLSAAVYGASEGLRTLVIDSGGIGGQATLSSLIRNYLGFPRGVSGRQLAELAYEQAWVFGAQFAFMQEATGLRREGERIIVGLSDFPEVEARAVVLAGGVAYRWLEVEDLEALALSGAGVFYGSTATEAPATAGREVFVVGGANSAGQAALHLADYARRVTLAVRADSLSAGMSNYLIEQVEAAPNIEVRLRTEVVGGGGDGALERLELRERGGGAPADGGDETETVPADALFAMIGARPNTGWLPTEILRDSGGFIRTGQSLVTEPEWNLGRAPFSLETSMPGVFAVGDVRNGSMSRVAAAVGEGSIAVRLVHELFAAERVKASPA